MLLVREVGDHKSHTRPIIRSARHKMYTSWTFMHPITNMTNNGLFILYMYNNVYNVELIFPDGKMKWVNG